jgi:nucleoside phosphorylase
MQAQPVQLMTLIRPGMSSRLKTIEPDRPHLRTKTPWVQTPDTIDGFVTTILATQDIPIHDVEISKELSAVTNLVDMEGASILQSARRLNTRCFLFIFVSDSPLHAGKGLIEFINNFIAPFCTFVSVSVIPDLKDIADK